MCNFENLTKTLAECSKLYQALLRGQTKCVVRNGNGVAYTILRLMNEEKYQKATRNPNSWLLFGCTTPTDAS